MLPLYLSYDPQHLRHISEAVGHSFANLAKVWSVLLTSSFTQQGMKADCEYLIEQLLARKDVI